MTERPAELAVSIDRWADDEPQPGIVEFSFADCSGRSWRFHEKQALVTEHRLDGSSSYPQAGSIRCTVLGSRAGKAGRRIVEIDTGVPWAIESLDNAHRFFVFAEQLNDLQPAEGQRMDFKSAIRTIPDFPKPGIMFRDVTTLFGDGEAFRAAIDTMVGHYKGVRIDKVAGIEARGFILGGAIAHQLGVGFVPIRKKGKLPYGVLGEDYDLEYGTDRIEIHIDAVKEGDAVIIVDDLIATGGTAFAAIKLMQRAGAKVVGCCFLVDLPELGGSGKIRAFGQDVKALVSFEGH